jgi:hypothetical protein
MIKFKIIVATTATSLRNIPEKKQLNTGNSELLTAILD